MPTVLRGALPSPRHRLAAAMPHQITTQAPPQFLWKPAQLSMWGNDVNGDCVTAEEAFAKGCAAPAVFITDAEVIAWATANGVLNGADLDQVISLMQSGGFVLESNTYDDGPGSSVDWTNEEVLQNAISLGPVKTGIAADQVEAVYQTNPTTGWVATGFTQDSDEDHCVSLCGYGPAGWLAAELGFTLLGELDPSAMFYAMFTWNSIGLIDHASLLAICGEAWLRQPTTVTR